MSRLSMILWSTFGLACAALSACGDDAGGADQPAPDAAPGTATTGASDTAAGAAGQGAVDDGSDGADGASAPAIDPEVLAMSIDARDAYDRSMGAMCTCMVASGAYADEAECLAFMGSGETWVDCGAAVFDEYDSPALREGIACFTAQAEERADCYEASQCSEDVAATCPDLGVQCLGGILDVLLVTLQRCPDFGLLSRSLFPAEQ